MTKAGKFALGLLTLLPVLYIMFFFSLFLFRLFTVVPFGTIITLHMSTILLTIILLVVYIRDLFRNNSVASENKALWGVVLFLGNVIAMPIYWYVHIWHESKYVPQRDQPENRPSSLQ